MRAKTRGMTVNDVVRAIADELWREICTFPAYLRQSFREQTAQIILAFLAGVIATVLITVGQAS